MTEEPITVYWRPGCGFSTSLVRDLERAGLEFERVDIWRDGQGAAFVRRVAGGNETVPTVRVGRTALVNPSTTEVLRMVADEYPDRLPEGYEAPRPGLLSRVVAKLLGG